MGLVLPAAGALWEELGSWESLEVSAPEACEPDHLPSATGRCEGLYARRGCLGQPADRPQVDGPRGCLRVSAHRQSCADPMGVCPTPGVSSGRLAVLILEQSSDSCASG